MAAKHGARNPGVFGSVAKGKEGGQGAVNMFLVNILMPDFLTDIVFDVNLQFGTNFSTLVVDQEPWETGMISVLPLRDEIMKDGIRL
jgi:hypothetical protein